MITLDEYLKAEHDIDLRQSKLGWRIHASVYAVVMTGLVALNIVVAITTTDDFLWFFFPLFGWGIGLVVHYLMAVRWAEREIERHQTEIERLAASRGSTA